MNKAFVKESDGSGATYCPRCGSLGTPVGEVTIAAQLAPELARGLADTGYFCPFPTCEVVYFDDFERTILASALGRPVYPKDADAPICGCFGLTEADIEQDLAEGGVTRVRALVERSRTAEAHCELRAVSGQCCVGDVQRYYMRRRTGGGA